MPDAVGTLRRSRQRGYRTVACTGGGVQSGVALLTRPLARRLRGASARADGKNCEIAALALYTPYSPSASVLARDTGRKAAGSALSRSKYAKTR